MSYVRLARPGGHTLCRHHGAERLVLGMWIGIADGLIAVVDPDQLQIRFQHFHVRHRLNNWRFRTNVRGHHCMEFRGGAPRPVGDRSRACPPVCSLSSPEIGGTDRFTFIARPPRLDRKCRKVVARQGTSAGRIAVRVEIAFRASCIELKEQISLAHGFLLTLSDLRPIIRSSRS